jgi:methionine-gamma-lyase
MKDYLKKYEHTTKTIHAGAYPDRTTGAVAPPIYQTSTFAFDNCSQGARRFAGKEQGYIYTRMGNPTVARLEEAVSVLEGGTGGIATASGMAALTTTLFALLNKGDHILATDSLYGPSRTVIERDFSRFGVESSFVDTSNLDQVRAKIRPQTKLIHIETPANPTLVLTDIAGVAKIAHEQDSLLMVDNTFASPILQHPLELGADIVMHSMTKFINGHSDVVSGMIVTTSAELLAKIRKVHNYMGACIDPHQAWLVLRGLKTLALRVRVCQQNAQKIAEFLTKHPKVEWIRYPGLKTHPQFELVERQMYGPGCVISFEVKGDYDAGVRLLDHVELMTLGVSLGGIETLIQHPSSMTHALIPREQRIKAGISDRLVRVSIGCEDVDDLITDFENAFNYV